MAHDPPLVVESRDLSPKENGYFFLNFHHFDHVQLWFHTEYGCTGQTSVWTGLAGDMEQVIKRSAAVQLKGSDAFTMAMLC